VPLTNLFKPRSFQDPVLGPLVRTRGQWRGAVTLGQAQPTPLAVLGSSSEPDPAALIAARQLPTSLEGWRPAIAQALLVYETLDGADLKVLMDGGTITRTRPSVRIKTREQLEKEREARQAPTLGGLGGPTPEPAT